MNALRAAVILALGITLQSAAPLVSFAQTAETVDAAPAAQTNELLPSSLLNKSISAYGGEALQKLSRGITIVAKEYDAPALEGENPRSGEEGVNVRVIRKGPRWRVDRESAAGPEESAARTVSQAFDGNTSWIKNGPVQDLPLDSASLLNWQTMPPALLLIEMKNGLDEGAIKFEYIKKDEEGHRILVKNLKDEKQSFVITFDTKNFMVNQLDFTLQSRLTTLQYGEYRPALGTVYPFKQVRKVAGKLVDVWIVEDASFETQIAASDFERPGGTTKLSHSIILPFDYSQKQLLVKGRLNNGEEVDLIFDTGASETIIDRRVAAESFLLKEGQADLAALAGNVATSTTTISRLDLNGLVVNDIEARILDLSGQSRQLGRRLAGIIGTNIISRYVVAIDYGKAQITFHDSETFVRPQDVTAVPFGKRSAPVIKIKAGTSDVQMLVDTGAAFNNLPAPVALKFVGPDSVKRLTEGTGLDGRPVKLGRVTVDSVTIGNRVLRKVDFTYTLSNNLAPVKDQPNQGFFQTTNLGIVGNPLLENFIVYMDYKFQRMLLKQSGTVKLRSDIEQALAMGDDQLVQKRDFRLAEQSYQKALLFATGGGDKKNEARIQGRLANLKRVMAKDLNRPEHSKVAYDLFVRAQALAKRIGASEVEGRILADWSLLYLDNGQLASAQQTMDRALFLAPQDAGVNVDCSVHLYKAQRYPEMQRYIEKALFLEPSNWQALWYQVKLSENFGDQPKAIVTLKEILRYYPWSKPAQEKLVEMQKMVNAMKETQAAATAPAPVKQPPPQQTAPLKNYSAGPTIGSPNAQNNYNFRNATPSINSPLRNRGFSYGPNTTPGMVPSKR